MTTCHLHCRKIFLCCWWGFMAGLLLVLTGCHDHHGEVRYQYQSRIVDVHTGPFSHSPVIEVHFEERRSYSSSGRLIGTRTSVSITNASSYDIDVTMDLHGYDWTEYVDIDRWYAWETINLGVVSYSSQAYHYPLEVDIWYVSGCGCAISF